MPPETEYNTEIMSDLRGFMTEDQCRSIYNATINDRDKVLIALLWKSGRRISEVLNVQVGDIDFENANILWLILKKKKHYKRWKPIDIKTLELLSWYVDTYRMVKTDYLIYSFDRNKPLSRVHAWRIVKKAAFKAGIEKVGTKTPHPHHFRHSFAVDKAKKIKNAAGIRLLQRYLEHSSLRMTEQYLQFDDKDMREVVDEE